MWSCIRFKSTNYLLEGISLLGHFHQGKESISSTFSCFSMDGFERRTFVLLWRFLVVKNLLCISMFLFAGACIFSLVSGMTSCLPTFISVVNRFFAADSCLSSCFKADGELQLLEFSINCSNVFFILFFVVSRLTLLTGHILLEKGFLLLNNNN